MKLQKTLFYLKYNSMVFQNDIFSTIVLTLIGLVITPSPFKFSKLLKSIKLFLGNQRTPAITAYAPPQTLVKAELSKFITVNLRN